jgi:hypothetical protein
VKRVVRRRPFKSTNKQDKFASSSLINAGGWNYKRKKFNPRAARRKLISASDAQQKHRSMFSVTGTAVTGVALGTQNVYFRAAIEDAGGGLRFWQTGGGLVVKDGDSPTTSFGGGDLFIRGGLVSHSFHNNGVVDVKLRTWRARTTKNSSVPPNPAATSSAWDPSIPLTGATIEDPINQFKFWDEVSVFLKPGEVWERKWFQRAEKIDQTTWIANADREQIIYSLENMTSIVASTIQVVASYNLSFTGDRDIF